MASYLFPHPSSLLCERWSHGPRGNLRYVTQQYPILEGIKCKLVSDPSSVSSGRPFRSGQRTLPVVRSGGASAPAAIPTHRWRRSWERAAASSCRSAPPPPPSRPGRCCWRSAHCSWRRRRMPLPEGGRAASRGPPSWCVGHGVGIEHTQSGHKADIERNRADIGRVWDDKTRRTDVGRSG